MLDYLLLRPTTTAAQTGPSAPPAAQSAGYLTRTFGPKPTLGTNWFNNSFYAAVVAGQSVQNADGTLSLPITGNGYGICSAQGGAGHTWAGTAFGGGAYFEAVISFPPSATAGVSWPAFWANDIETMSQNAVVAANTWPGIGTATFVATVPAGSTVMTIASVTAGTVIPHMGLTFPGMTGRTYITSFGTFNGTSGTVNLSIAQNGATGVTVTTVAFGDWIEFDFFERDLVGTTSYGCGAHSWHGGLAYNTDTRTTFGANTITPAVFSSPNKIGFLWIPATAGIAGSGSATWYFNDVLRRTVVWDPYNPLLGPPPVYGTSAFCIADTRHMAMILNTNVNCPMLIQSVSVWQVSAANNIYSG